MNGDELILFLRDFGLAIAGIMAVSLLLCFILLAITYRTIRKLNISPQADLTETLQQVPLLLVLAIDLLDLALDIFATPIVWILLDRLNLKALRNISTIEALIPFTGPIPTLTLAWLAVRLLGIRF